MRNVDIKNDANSIFVYPNPIADLLYISGNDIAYISLYDLSGRLVKVSNNASTNRISTSQLSEGMYVLVATKTDGTRTPTTVVVKH